MSGKMRPSARIVKPLAIYAVTLALVLAGSVGGDDNSRTSISRTSASVSQSSVSPANTTLKPSDCANDPAFRDIKPETLTKLQAKCYEFTGQENWDNPNGKTVTLPVALFPGSAPQLDPVLYVPGGPGSTALQERYGGFSIEEKLEAVSPRPLLLVDARGLRHAKPALECPGFNEIHHWYRRFAPTIYDPKPLNKRISQMADFVKDCYRKLTREGIDVSQYTDVSVTRDFDEIRKALGYETINLWGLSAGPGTVETYLRYYGAHTRAVILEAPWYSHLRNRPPLDAFYTQKQVINDVLSICVRDNEECARRFPGYLAAVDSARAILDAKPYEATVTTEAGDQRRIRIDGATFLAHLFYPGFSDTYHLLPKVLEAINLGDYEALDEFFSLDRVDSIGGSTVASGYQLAVLCGDMGKNRPTPKEGVDMIKRESALMGFDPFPFCGYWGKDGDVPPSLNTPPVSDVAALAIHGQVDICCTTRWSDLMAKTMPNLQRVEIQAQGHVESQNDCRATRYQRLP